MFEITVRGVGHWSRHRKRETAERELLKAKKRFGHATLWKNDKKLID